MKRQAALAACACCLSLALVAPAAADEQLRELAGSLTKLTNRTLSGQDQPIWLKNTSVKFDVADSQPSWLIKTLQPVRQTGDEALFWQGRVWQENGRTVSTMGSAYRWLTDDRGWALGLNGFRDQDVGSNAKRFSIGGEAFSEDISLRANLYNAIGDPVAAPENQSLARDGFDLQLETPTPFPGRTHLSLATAQWHLPAANQPVQRWRAALKTNPSQRLSMELGASRNGGEDPALYLNLTYRFGRHGKPESALSERLAPQDTSIVREFTLQPGSS